MQLKDFESLEEARLHTEKRGVILNANDMGVLFDKHPGTLAALESIESVNESVKIFLTLFRSGGGRYDFREKPADIKEVTDGEQLKTKMQQLVEAGVVSLNFATDVFNAANPVYKPYGNISEYDFKRAKGISIDKKEATPVNGWLKITISQDVEPHRPHIYADVQGVMQRVTGFGLVEKAGDYLAQVPRGYSTFYVDDSYGAIQ